MEPPNFGNRSFPSPQTSYQPSSGFAHWAYNVSPYRDLVPFPAALGEIRPAASESNITNPQTHSPPITDATMLNPLISGTIGQFLKINESMFEPPSSTISHPKVERDATGDSGSTLNFVPHDTQTVKDEVQACRQTGNFTRLACLDLGSLDNNQVLFYFGILATQAMLLPRFQYSTGKGDKPWGVKLTMYGLTVAKCHVYKTQHEAKVGVCRDALKKLKGGYLDWPVPYEPTMSVAPPGWNWVEILRDYCIHNGVPGPKYTKYSHDCGYRHEVEVSGSMYFGALKHYPSELESQNAAAHMAIHSLLVQENGIHCAFPGPFILKRYDENFLALVPRPLPRGEMEEETENNSRHRLGKSRKRARVVKSPVVHSHRNANAQPLENCRLPPIKVNVEKVESKWKVTPTEISEKLRCFESQLARLENLCDLLPLELPEIRVERLDGRLIESEGEYRAGAYFNADPFLLRAGAIGHIENMKGTKAETREACARKTVDYLISLVEEDTALENHVAKEREDIIRYGEIAL